MGTWLHVVHMKEIDSILVKACDSVPSLPAYDPDDQYSSPFACESARPGNYFKNAGLTDNFRKAYMRDEFPETLADVAYDMIDTVEDVSWAKDEHDQNRQLIGTMRMLLRRWAKGGRAEALAMIEYGHVDELTAIKTVFDKTGEMYDDRQDMDENGHIDFVSPDGQLIQVKSTVNRPSYSENKDYELLVWVKPETYEIVEIRS